MGCAFCGFFGSLWSFSCINPHFQAGLCAGGTWDTSGWPLKSEAPEVRGSGWKECRTFPFNSFKSLVKKNSTGWEFRVFMDIKIVAQGKFFF